MKEIKVEVIARAADILGDPHKYRPDSKETADHSLPYCMAVGLVDGMVTPLQFKEERVLDKSLIPIMDKVKVVANDEFEALFPKFQPSRVTITTNDGKEYSTRVDVPKGDPRDPMTEEEIAVKFTALGGDVIGKEQCEKLRQCIMNLENRGKARRTSRADDRALIAERTRLACGSTAAPKELGKRRAGYSAREASEGRRVPVASTLRSVRSPDYAVALPSPAPNWIPCASGSSVEKLIVFV